MEVGVRDLKARLSAFLARAERGEVIGARLADAARELGFSVLGI